MQNLSGGLLLLLFASLMNSSFSMPMKLVRGWAWENTWVVWTLFCLLLLPFGLAWGTVPGYGAILAAAGGTLVPVMVCGAAWGVAQVLFGVALERVGIALTYSIVLGLSAAMGCLIPLVRFHPGELFAPAGRMALGGTLLVLLGVTICAFAGRLRDTSLRKGGATEHAHYGWGLTIAVISGVCASMMNVGFAYGSPLMDAAAAHGTRLLWQSVAAWAPLLAAGSGPNLLYCFYLLRRNRTAGKYATRPLRNGSMALAMAVLWLASSIVYGASTTLLGTLGKVVGWPLFMSLVVILAGAIGVLAGEWKGSDPRALRLQTVAVVVLVGAVLLLSRAAS